MVYGIWWSNSPLKIHETWANIEVEVLSFESKVDIKSTSGMPPLTVPTGSHRLGIQPTITDQQALNGYQWNANNSEKCWTKSWYPPNLLKMWGPGVGKNWSDKMNRSNIFHNRSPPYLVGSSSFVEGNCWNPAKQCRERKQSASTGRAAKCHFLQKMN